MRRLLLLATLLPALALAGRPLSTEDASTLVRGKHAFRSVAVEKPVGGRYTPFEKFDVDHTYVTRSGGAKEDRYWSLGFHWETDPFLP